VSDDFGHFKGDDMIRAGDSIENPVTGERLVFRQTSRETGGEAVVIETYVKPNGFVAAAHVHPSQEERFQVLRGSVGFRVGRTKIVAGPGQRLTVPPGTPHKFWNAGEETAHFVCEIRPALQFESLIETMFSLAADGKTNRKGMPNPLRLAVIANAHFDTVQLPFPPAFLQRFGLALGAPLGKALGYGPVYIPAAGVPVTLLHYEQLNPLSVPFLERPRLPAAVDDLAGRPGCRDPLEARPVS